METDLCRLANLQRLPGKATEPLLQASTAGAASAFLSPSANASVPRGQHDRPPPPPQDRGNSGCPVARSGLKRSDSPFAAKLCFILTPQPSSGRGLSLLCISLVLCFFRKKLLLFTFEAYLLLGRSYSSARILASQGKYLMFNLQAFCTDYKTFIKIKNP